MSDTAIITLHYGHTAIIDAADLELVSQFSWYPRIQTHTTYAYRYLYGERTGSTLPLHRFLLGEPDCLVDHINGNGLDNRRANLRLANRSQNAWHAKRELGRTGFRGVLAKRGMFEARLQVHRKRIHFGTYGTAIEAAVAYDAAAKKHHGEFAILNFPEQHT